MTRTSIPAPAADARRPKRREWCQRAALSGVSLALGLAVAELAVRFAPPDLTVMRGVVVEDPLTGYALRPGSRRPFAGMYSSLPEPVLWQVNPQGLRDHRVIRPTPERFRIATYGDSETFGWSVNLADTYQQQMEALDPRAEVLNFGVPGFNVTDIANHMARTLADYSPDLVFYLVHKNDFDDPVRVHQVVVGSHLLVRLRFLHHFTWAKPARVRRRHSPERTAVFARDVARMAELCEARDVRLVLGLLKWSNRAALGDLATRLQVVNVHAVTDRHPKLDAHLTPEAYRELAGLLCASISGTQNQCVPGGWSRAPEAGETLAGARPFSSEGDLLARRNVAEAER